MSFDKKLKLAIEEIEIPEELMPSNIEAMLRALDPVQETDTERSAEETRANIKVSSGRTNRAIIMRTLAAAAACVALAAGITAIRTETEPEPIESRIEYEAVQVQSYDELYNIYTGIYLKNGEAAGAENGDGVEIITDETAITDGTETTAANTEPIVTEAAIVQETEITAETTQTVRSDFSDADIVKSDERSIYYICSGTLYVVNKENMEVTTAAIGENAPFEMFVRGNSLVLISEENASDQNTAQKNVVADIYDTSSGIPQHTAVYKQNGSYISARVDESGILYLVTDYSDYRKDPLNETAELENYVPGYFINGSKNYVAPEDIFVPRYADNTDYTVVSSVSCTAPENASVKAVLGSGRNVYCTDKILYIIGGGMTEGKDYTAVTSFDITDNGLGFIASTVLNGEFIGKKCIAQTGEMFRIACRSYDENGMAVTDIYTLDRALQTVSSVNSLLPGVIVGKIIYNDNYASIMERGSDEPVQVVDLSRSTPVQGNESADFFASYVNNYLGSMVGISASKDDAGSILSLRLEMYSSDNGAKLSEVSFGDIPNVTSPALTDKKAMLVDEEAKVIGIPVTGKNEFGVINRYYVFTADENGNLTEKGYIEYSDITDSFKFERAVINDGVLIIIGNGRIVTVDLDSMTVIETVDFN